MSEELYGADLVELSFAGLKFWPGDHMCPECAPLVREGAWRGYSYALFELPRAQVLKVFDDCGHELGVAALCDGDIYIGWRLGGWLFGDEHDTDPDANKRDFLASMERKDCPLYLFTHLVLESEKEHNR